jgi:hypothetical protein
LIDVEIYTPSGVLMGTTAHVPLTSDGPDLVEALTVSEARWYPVDGTTPSKRGEVSVDPDDILLIITPEPELKVHMAWYSIALEVGPYRISAAWRRTRASTRPAP